MHALGGVVLDGSFSVKRSGLVRRMSSHWLMLYLGVSRAIRSLRDKIESI
jgi:hypothetical protein